MKTSYSIRTNARSCARSETSPIVLLIRQIIQQGYRMDINLQDRDKVNWVKKIKNKTLKSSLAVQ